MCRFSGWEKDSNNMYPIERENASAKFRIAMVRTFNQKFGEGLEVNGHGYSCVQPLESSQCRTQFRN